MRRKLLMRRIIESFVVFTIVGFTPQPVVRSQTINTERSKSSQSQSVNNDDTSTSKGSVTDHIPHQIGCASPEILVNGAPSPDIVETVSGGNFATIEEIQFVGVIGTIGQKRVCKIKCINGVWVGPLCALEQRQVLECPPFNTDDDIYLRISDHNRTFGSQAYFSCSSGYKLIGPDFVTCLKNGSWSEHIPHCEAITCLEPIAPCNGRLLDNGRYLAGDYVQFTCNSGYVMSGESLSICMDNGTWSSPPPQCTVTCEYPGELANGHFEPTKFNYNIDEIVTVVCRQNYRLLGSPILKCNANGLWSSPKPHCRPLYF